MKTGLYKSKNWLYQKYIIEELSTPKIAKICNLNSCVTIWNWLRKFKIQLRGRGCSLEKHGRWKGGKKRLYGVRARKIWEEHCDYKIPKGFVIHHKDEDHKNNDVLNLVFLPHGLHARIHWRKWRERRLNIDEKQGTHTLQA